MLGYDLIMVYDESSPFKNISNLERVTFIAEGRKIIFPDFINTSAARECIST